MKGFWIFIGITVAIVYGFYKLMVHEGQYAQEYQTKCEAAGGTMLMYSHPKQSTQYSRVKKEDVIDIQ